jgi:DNA-binding IclR family transcriptional regulator
VFDRAGAAAGAIGIVGPVERLYTRRQPRAPLIGHVREAARAISRELGASRW